MQRRSETPKNNKYIFVWWIIMCTMLSVWLPLHAVCLLQSEDASKCSALCTSSGWRKRDYLIFGVALMETQFRSNQSNVCYMNAVRSCAMHDAIWETLFSLPAIYSKCGFLNNRKIVPALNTYELARTHICMFRPRTASSICAAASLTYRQFSNLYILWHYAT